MPVGAEVGGEGECVGLTAARAERDVDLGRLDHYPGGTSSSSLPVRVCSVWLRASTSSWIRASPAVGSGSKCSGRAGDSPPPVHGRPACTPPLSRRGGRRADDGGIEVADAAGEALRAMPGLGSRGAVLPPEFRTRPRTEGAERTRAVSLRRPAVGILSAWLDQPVGRAERGLPER